jgi:aldehyde:ferredoxin oxidoreductase
MKYYGQAGWDQNGIPTSETLANLGLQKVDASLNELRSRIKE